MEQLAFMVTELEGRLSAAEERERQAAARVTDLLEDEISGRSVHTRELVKVRSEIVTARSDIEGLRATLARCRQDLTRMAQSRLRELREAVEAARGKLTAAQGVGCAKAAAALIDFYRVLTAIDPRRFAVDPGQIGNMSAESFSLMVKRALQAMPRFRNYLGPALDKAGGPNMEIPEIVEAKALLAAAESAIPQVSEHACQVAGQDPEAARAAVLADQALAKLKPVPEAPAVHEENVPRPADAAPLEILPPPLSEPVSISGAS